MDGSAELSGLTMPDTAVNVLLVDDSQNNLTALESVLAGPDLRLVRAQTPDQALLRLVHHEFACIVLDVQMPGMNGLELASLIKTRKRSRHIPIIFLTAFFSDEKEILKGYGAGAVDYLTKPVDPKILRSKVGVFVDLFRTARALAAANQALQTEVSQRKRAEEALRESNSQLELRVQERVQDLKKAHDELLVASRAKDNFLATLSHELRTPLNPILLVASDASRNPNLPPKVRADFEMVLKNVELEARLIDDLLDLTRISRGKIFLEKTPVDVRVVLRDAVSNVQEEIQRKKIVSELKLRAMCHMVFGDAVRLQQIFWNVIRNAVKFTPDGGCITVETATSGENELIVKITDTGIGMNRAEIARLFTPFSQNDESGAGHRFGGLGLGLTISQKLLELHSGRICARSDGRGRGSTFTVAIPLMSMVREGGDDTGATNSDVDLNRPVPASVSGIRILLVEDHEPTRAALTRLLDRRGYRVSAASSLAEARRLSAGEDFNLVISDIGLPDGNGYELMAELKEQKPVKGIALTGYGMVEDVARSQNAGFVAHLTKPVRIQSLEAALLAAARAIHPEA